MGFPTKNDHDLGCEMRVPPFKETPQYSNEESSKFSDGWHCPVFLHPFDLNILNGVMSYWVD